MPLQAFWRIIIWSYRLLWMLGCDQYQEKEFIFEWENMIIARKCLSNGIIDAVWFSLPISVSKFMALVSSFDNISWIVFVQDMKLGSGKLTHNVCVLYNHPKRTFISSNASSDFAFDDLIIFSLGTVSSWDNGREKAWIASDIATFPLALCLPISGMTVI